MEFQLPPLPYEKTALEPHMGRETLEYHYEKHHRGYLQKLRKAIEGKPLAGEPLEEIVRAAEGGVFDNAAQVWNHTFFWESMESGGGGAPGGEAGRLIKQAFGSFDGFRTAFIEAGASRFGSGYAWLVLDDGKPGCLATLNAETPLRSGATPLLTCDVWEHAYYLDHRNDRKRYLATFLDHLVNWDRVSARIERAAVTTTN
jgi:Fe-Mn family superoxide dismutase